MFGSSTMTRAVCPLTLRAIDLVIDWLSYVSKARGSDSLRACPVNDDRHLATQRMLSNARGFVFVAWRESRLRRCDRASSAVQHEQVAVAHVRGAGEDPAGAGGCQPRAAEDHCGAAQFDDFTRNRDARRRNAAEMHPRDDFDG